MSDVFFFKSVAKNNKEKSLKKKKLAFAYHIAKNWKQLKNSSATDGWIN